MATTAVRPGGRKGKIGERDAFAPARTVARPMRDAAPRAQLVVLEAGTHGSLFGHARMIVEAIERFFGEHDV